jgi:hypothetical protein
MQPQGRVTAAGVVEQTDVGKDHRIDAKGRRAIDGALPVGRSSRLGEGIDRHQNLAVTRLGVADTFDHRLVVEIQAGDGKPSRNRESQPTPHHRPRHRGAGRFADRR